MRHLLYPIDMRRDLHAEMSGLFTRYLSRDMTVYDIGCGAKPFEKMLSGQVKEHIGVDLENGFYGSAKVDLIGTAYDVPVPDGVADAVISSQVLEHLEKPVEALREAARVLRPGGMLFLSFPLLYPIHVPPHDYGRYTKFYMRRVLESQRFEVLEEKSLCGFWYVSGLNIGLYLQSFNRGIFRKLQLVQVVIAILQWVCRFLHFFEGIALKLAGKKLADFRETWTTNYIVLARKTISP